MANIKLFICCHQPTEVPKHPLLVPIQVGTALTSERFPGFLYDDTGDNISRKNRSYCELTAQYWAWKNMDADYYGFFHYRRYLYPDVRAKRPYRIERKPELSLLNRLGYENFAELIQRYDMILPLGENMYIPVRKHYAKAPFHHEKDLKLTEEIAEEFFPEYKLAMEQNLSGTVCHFGNIFIMRKKLFQDYCKWLFSILSEFDKRADTSGYGPQEIRVDGYLGERLLGVYIEQFKKDPSARIRELPRVFFYSNRVQMWERRAVDLILPPGSRKRAAAKRFMTRSSRYTEGSTS